MANNKRVKLDAKKIKVFAYLFSCFFAVGMWLVLICKRLSRLNMGGGRYLRILWLPHICSLLNLEKALLFPLKSRKDYGQ